MLPLTCASIFFSFTIETRLSLLLPFPSLSLEQLAAPVSTATASRLMVAMISCVFMVILSIYDLEIVVALILTLCVVALNLAVNEPAVLLCGTELNHQR